MSELGDDFRESRERRQAHRRLHTEECPGCCQVDPRRNPSLLYAGQTCGYCGYKRPEQPSPRETSPHQCPKCPRRCMSEQGLRDHLRMKHGAAQ